MSPGCPIPAYEAQEPVLDVSPSLDVLPDLIPGASPMFHSSLNPTPAHESVGREYFTPKVDSKTSFQHDLPFRSNITTSIIASQVEDRKKISFYTPITVDYLLFHDLNPTHQMFNSEPFAPSTEGPCFASPAQAFWYRKTSTHLSSLLENASYPPRLQAQYLDFFNHSIIPAFGPILSLEAKWRPHTTHNQSPFEPSWNIWGQDRITPQEQIRFTFEPIGPLAGTDEDPFNQLIPRFFVSALASSNACPVMDLEWWHYFIGELFVTSAEAAQANEVLPLGQYPPTCFLAFALPTKEFAPVMKPYLFPHRRALLEGKTNTEVILSTIKKLHSSTPSLLPAISKIESFLSTSKSESEGTSTSPSNLGVDGTEMSLEMLSFDCISTTQSPRLKLYLKTDNTSFQNIKNIYTLANSRSGPEIDTGLKLFKQFWECLTGLEGEWRSASAQTTPFLYFGLEIAPGNDDVGVKIYIPAWTCGIEEQGVREGLRNFFLARGWGVGEDYGGKGGVEGLGHTYLSFAYDETQGVYVTMYYSPFMERVGDSKRAGVDHG